jgi:hypothetical protein
MPREEGAGTTEMIKCNEVARLAASGELGTGGIWRRLQLRLHLAMCRHCSRFVRQIDALRSISRRLWRPGVDPEPVPDAGGLEARVLAVLVEGTEGKNRE